jgi:hypothetical protein
MIGSKMKSADISFEVLAFFVGGQLLRAHRQDSKNAKERKES